MKKKNKTVIHTGTASLILIFAILSLVVFSMLSLASASAQRQLAEKLADHTAAYYKAETKAQETLSQVILAIQQKQEEMQPGEAAAKELGLTFEEDCISWQIPVTENQRLQVRLRILPEEQGKKRWELEQWRLEYTGTWKNKQTLELFGTQEGEEETCR